MSVSLPFNEIVTVTGTPTLSTTWGDLSYVAGSGANVLTFAGAATAIAGTQLRLTGLSGGTVNISSGVEQHCKWMYLPKEGGTSPWRRARTGRYTSATFDYISGDGAIVVDGDGSGTVIIFK